MRLLGTGNVPKKNIKKIKKISPVLELRKDDPGRQWVAGDR